MECGNVADADIIEVVRGLDACVSGAQDIGLHYFEDAVQCGYLVQETEAHVA
jgi:hypothetical protein